MLSATRARTLFSCTVSQGDTRQYRPFQTQLGSRLLGENRGLDVAAEQRQIAGLEMPRLAGAHKIDEGGTFGFGQMRWRAQAGCASI